MFILLFLYVVLLITSIARGNPLYYIAGVNIITFLLMGYDKMAARKRRYRLPERLFLTNCLIGGSLGCILAMLLYHHKTEKKNFHLPVIGIFMAQILIIIIFRSIQ
ncbi:MAG: DUF1294 domain-containing protein [Lentisphaeria bacterium]|jgi:uncharacterized membrane protein YsdA (DUF1294 family)|nr:DUF1294 domain-containing protein [Lentisphaeria bacterium]